MPQPLDETEVESPVPLQHPNMSDEDYRLLLIDCIDDIDATKRDIKAQIHSRNIYARENRTSVDQAWQRRAKDKVDHLTRERVEVRNALHEVNERIKETRRARNGQAVGTLAEHFMRAAKQILPEEDYLDVLDEATRRFANQND